MDADASLPPSPPRIHRSEPYLVSPVIEAVVNRRSVRSFLPTPVPLRVVKEILSAASRAPSGTNFQPWKVHVTTGATLARLCRAVTQAAMAGERSDEYFYAPAPLMEPYLSRRRKVGYDLYELYGIARDDYPARKQAMLRNFEFFGAPVGLFFTMDRRLLVGSWLDCGMFMQNVMIVARAFGLGTCAQQAWCEYGGVVHEQLGIPASQIILSGMALGHPDPDSRANTLVSDRVGVDDFTVVHE
ncbi:MULTISPECIES: nitroreductase [unclassified Bradyrhizobium]|uniref:nitroreductase n=1 Tax=unclassified Bradyrhizobium TaxID=2631580 RepID=UPI002FF3057F